VPTPVEAEMRDLELERSGEKGSRNGVTFDRDLASISRTSVSAEKALGNPPTPTPKKETITNVFFLQTKVTQHIEEPIHYNGKVYSFTIYNFTSFARSTPEQMLALVLRSVYTNHDFQCWMRQPHLTPHKK
jgi:hypothetical protein